MGLSFSFRFGMFCLLVANLFCPLHLEFELDLLHLGFQFFLLLKQLSITFSLGINRARQIAVELLVVTAQLNQRSDRHAASLGTVFDVGTGFVFAWVKAEAHVNCVRELTIYPHS